MSCLSAYFHKAELNQIIYQVDATAIKGRFLEFRRYHYFANLFSKLSESTFYKEISKFH